MIELVICNNDGMAEGAISALNSAGYNKGGSSRQIPVFGVDATSAAIDLIKKGKMTGTIKQDAEGMAQTMVKVLDNYVNGKDGLDGIAKENIEGSRKVNIPYAKYLGDNE